MLLLGSLPLYYLIYCRIYVTLDIVYKLIHPEVHLLLEPRRQKTHYPISPISQNTKFLHKTCMLHMAVSELLLFIYPCSQYQYCYMQLFVTLKLNIAYYNYITLCLSLSSNCHVYYESQSNFLQYAATGSSLNSSFLIMCLNVFFLPFVM